MNLTHKPSKCSALSCNTRSARRRAFTLIELLTVIAIIGILAAILIPTVSAVRKRATKAQCASNLHQLGMAVTLFKNDHKGYLPDGDRGTSPQVQWIPTAFRDEMMSYGMTFEMLFCNGNPTYRDTWMTDAQRRLPSGNNMPIGYLYLPGTSAQTLSGKNSNYKVLLESKVNYRLIAADLNRKYQNTFAGGANHSDNIDPVGANHLYIDGSVRWFSADTFIAQAALVSSNPNTDYFFKTEE